MVGLRRRGRVEGRREDNLFYLLKISYGYHTQAAFDQNTDRSRGLFGFSPRFSTQHLSRKPQVLHWYRRCTVVYRPSPMCLN